MPTRKKGELMWHYQHNYQHNDHYNNFWSLLISISFSQTKCQPWWKKVQSSYNQHHHQHNDYHYNSFFCFCFFERAVFAEHFLLLWRAFLLLAGATNALVWSLDITTPAMPLIVDMNLSIWQHLAFLTGWTRHLLVTETVHILFIFRYVFCSCCFLCFLVLFNI